ncbi:MAG: flagellar biosynthetic protein FliO [Proteobacteria bacterium]|nr:flagellar biosynthetic protein FliO [Pseudomonadota bacterium]
MPLADFARAIFALLLTLGLVGLGAVALRRWGPGILGRVGRPGAQKRMAIVESLVLAPTRRLVIVTCDGQERLLLLGEGRLVSDLPAAIGPAPGEKA